MEKQRFITEGSFIEVAKKQKREKENIKPIENGK